MKQSIFLFLRVKHPTVWHLIRKMKYEVAADYAKLALDDVGEIDKKITKLGQMRTTESRLQELCARFVSGKINIPDFLNSIIIIITLEIWPLSL